MAIQATISMVQSMNETDPKISPARLHFPALWEAISAAG